MAGAVPGIWSHASDFVILYVNEALKLNGKYWTYHIVYKQNLQLNVHTILIVHAMGQALHVYCTDGDTHSVNTDLCLYIDIIHLGSII